MTTHLPFSIHDLLRTPEGPRVEFKKSWNMGPVALQVLHTICAFANDYYNLNGGYLILGVAASNGVAELPPCGLEASRVETIQKQILQRCRQLRPIYRPILVPQIVDDRHLLVVWVPPSHQRPHTAPKSQKGKHQYYVRMGAETKAAEGDVFLQLARATAPVPFDDDAAFGYTTSHLRVTLVREFLQEAGLADDFSEVDDVELYRSLELTTKTNDHEVPRNVALLFFTDRPDKIFPGAYIRCAHFRDGAGGDLIEEREFYGPLHRQVHDCVAYLSNRNSHHIRNNSNGPEASTWMTYPLAAIREAVANAVHHRDYQSTPRPIEVCLYPDRLVVTSYPGPVPGLRKEDLRPGRELEPLPLRNRRIGGLLRRIKLAEQWRRGVQRIFRAMSQNGSPEPVFDFNETGFTVRLPARREYQYDIFIVHRPGSRPWVRFLAKNLKERGYHVYGDWDLEPGDSLRPGDAEAWGRSQKAILVAAQQDVRSGWLRAEYERTLERSVHDPSFTFVIVLCGDGVETPFFESVKCFDFRNPHPDAYRRAFYRLLCGLEDQTPMRGATIEGELEIPDPSAFEMLGWQPQAPEEKRPQPGAAKPTPVAEGFLDRIYVGLRKLTSRYRRHY